MENNPLTIIRLVVIPKLIIVRPLHAHPPPPRFLLQKQIEELEELKNLRIQTDDYNRMPPLKSIWTFPCHNLLQLNTDGSSNGNPGPSSFGGLIRDNNGRWVCGYMGKMNGRRYTALEAEVWGIFQGLCLIKEMNLSFLLIETDCLAAVRLTVKLLDNDHPLKHIIEAIKGLMVEHRCTIVHTKRDGNHCADQLAKLGGKQSEDYLVLEKPPALLMPYLLRDVEAASDGFQRNAYH